MDITLTTVDGGLSFGGTTSVTVRSTVFGGFAIALTVGALAFLAIWWANHFRRTRRGEAPDQPHADVTEPGAPGAAARRRTRQQIERAGLARSSIAVATGTLLSRVTGLVRIAALAYAVGGASLADAYNLANTTPNIVYELLLGGIISATIVPIFVQPRRGRRAPIDIGHLHRDVDGAHGLHDGRDGLHAVDRPPVLDRRRRRRTRRAAIRRHRADVVLPASDDVLRTHRPRDGAAERAPPVRRRGVRAGAEQCRRHRCDARVRGTDIAQPPVVDRRRTVARRAGPRAAARTRHDRRHRGDGDCAHSGDAARRRPHTAGVRVARRRCPHDGSALRLDARLRRDESDRAALRARPREDRLGRQRDRVRLRIHLLCASAQSARRLVDDDDDARAGAARGLRRRARVCGATSSSDCASS